MDEAEAKACWRFVLEAFSNLNSLQNPWAVINEAQLQKLKALQDELLTGKPVQYLAEKAPFMHFWLKVTQAVLIPRPETEELVVLIKNLLIPEKVRSILDLGTGSGCIALGLHHYYKNAGITAVDASSEALMVARENFSTYAPEVKVLLLDLLTMEIPDEEFDIIVSNPPYIPLNERTTLSPRVSENEPSMALFVPNNDPLLFYRIIGSQAVKRLSSHGILAFETHFHYAEKVKSMLINLGFEAQVEKDMQGLQRMVWARKPLVISAE